MTSKTTPSPSFPKPRSNDATKNIFNSARIAGIVMPERFKVLYVIYSIIINLVLFIIVPLAFALSYYFGWENLKINDFLISLQFALNAVACAIKFLFIIYYRKRYYEMMHILDKLDARIKYPEEIRASQKIIRFGNRIVLIIGGFYFLFSSLTFVGGVFNGKPSYGMYIPFVNWHDSVWSLLIASTIEYLLGNVIVFQQMLNDVYSIIYVELINTHMEILVNRVSRIGTGPQSKSTQEDNVIELVQCIYDHKNILELVDNLAPAISGTYFIQFSATAIDLGISILSIAVFKDNSALFGRVSYAVCLIVELLPCCYCIDNLTATTRRLPDAIFHMNWMDQSLKFRRLCLFFMQRSQEDIKFIAGKIFPISLETFVSIVKFAFSLYTLIKDKFYVEDGST